MSTFRDLIGPFALEIIKQLACEHERLVNTNGSDESRELAAASTITAMRRVVEAVYLNRPLLKALRCIMVPVLKHAVTKGFEYSFEDAIKCIVTFVYFDRSENKQIDPQMWCLFSTLARAVGGDKGSKEGGPAF